MMPAFKAIAGHTGCAGVKKYLEAGTGISCYLEGEGRALARDFFNLSWDERKMQGYDEDLKSSIDWAAEMDATRALFGNDTPHGGKEARTYKHFVISPSPEDAIDLDSLRELACAWALRHFADHQIAIVYHDDNENRIPHAHIVVNNTNLETGRRMQTENRFCLNRSLQDMARARQLRAFSNLLTKTEGEKEGSGKNIPAPARPLTHIGKAEARITKEGGYSWVADIRSRVEIARGLARNEGEFRQILSLLDVELTTSTSKRTPGEWLYSVKDRPAQKVSAAKLGSLFSRSVIERRMRTRSDIRPSAEKSKEMLGCARHAVLIADTKELYRLAGALEVCSRFCIRSIDDIERRIKLIRLDYKEAPLSSKAQESISALEAAKEYLGARALLPKTAPVRTVLRASTAGRSASKNHAGNHRRKSRHHAQESSRQREREHER